jgi:hypothetical protein
VALTGQSAVSIRVPAPPQSRGQHAQALTAGVDNVNTFRCGLGGKGPGPVRIPHVFAGSQCLQGMEDSSSPTSGTMFPRVRSFSRAKCVQYLTY